MSLQLCSSRRGIVVGYSADCRRGFSCRDHHTIDGPELWFVAVVWSTMLSLCRFDTSSTVGRADVPIKLCLFKVLHESHLYL
jgi:hypothetical protein